jgi:hypothetical protein
MVQDRTPGRRQKDIRGKGIHDEGQQYPVAPQLLQFLHQHDGKAPPGQLPFCFHMFGLLLNSW